MSSMEERKKEEIVNFYKTNNGYLFRLTNLKSIQIKLKKDQQKFKM